MKLTLEKFKEEIQRHKSIKIFFPHPCGCGEIVMMYDLDKGNIVHEVYTYNMKAYTIAKIDNDEALSWWINIGLDILRIEPTPTDDLRRCNFLYCNA